VIIFDRKTRLYFQALGHWTTNPAEAYVFQTGDSAVNFCHYHALHSVLVIKNGSAGQVVLHKVPKDKHPPRGRRRPKASPG
jgi:hypothetical protein